MTVLYVSHSITLVLIPKVSHVCWNFMFYYLTFFVSFFARPISVWCLFRNMHPSLQYTSCSLIHIPCIINVLVFSVESGVEGWGFRVFILIF